MNDDLSKETLDALNDMKEAVRNTARASESVKSGEVTEEEELQEPEYLLINQIIDNVMEVFEREDIQTYVVELGKRLGPESSQLLTQLLALVCSVTVNNAIQFYDKLLTASLKDTLDVLFDQVNTLKADSAAHEASIEIHTKKIGDIENTLQIESIKKDIYQ